MITFKQHIEISKAAGEEGGLFAYISRLSPEDKVRVTRDIAETYPLKMNMPPSGKLMSEFKAYTNVMDLVLGQFIMLEQIITGKTAFDTDAENDLAIAKLILRPKHHKEFDNENPQDELKNSNNILNYSVQEVYSVISKFLSNRDYVLFKQFSGVFYEVPDDDDLSEEQADEETSNQMFGQQWYWYSMVRMLAKEDITRYDEIYMLKMSTVMPEMSYLAQKNKIESAEQRKQQALSKL